MSALAFLVVSGCDSPETRVNVAAELKEVPPFDRIDSLVLPSRVEELAEVRPDADSTVFGLSERVDGAEVWYVGEQTRYDAAVPSDAVVRHVTASFQPMTDDSAAQLWSEIISRLRLRDGADPECFVHPEFGPGRPLALLPFHGGVIYMTGKFSTSVPERPEDRQGSVVRIGIALDSSDARPLFVSAKKMPCDSLGRI